MKFNHLNVPSHWQNYWTRYPEGHTILEALISWVSQVDEMVDNQNKLNDNVEQFRKEIVDFIGRFDERLQDEVTVTLKDWQQSGFLDVVINEALKTKYHEMDKRLTAQLEHKIGMGVKATPEDLSAETLGMITGTGDPVNLLSIPQDYSVSPIKTDFIQTPINLFNKDDTRNQHGKLLNSNSGNIVDFSGGVISHPIKIKSGQTVTAYFDPQFGANSRIFCYMENDTFVSSFKPTMSGNIGTLTIPENPYEISYMRINVSKDKLDSTMVVLGSDYPEKYLPHVYKLKEDFALNDRQLNQINSNESPLQGKTVAWNGDSIMIASHTTDGGFAKTISEKNNMTWENRAKGGGTITAETYTDTGAPRHWVVRDIPNMRADADYIILEGGVNDGSLGVPIGTITEGYADPLDDTTFCGAFESMIKQTYQRYEGKKIGFVQVHNMTDSQAIYVPYVYQILEKWGIPYIDLFKEAPPFKYIQHLNDKYTYNQDGWHPNELGYAKYYTDKIEAFMKTL